MNVRRLLLIVVLMLAAALPTAGAVDAADAAAAGVNVAATEGQAFTGRVVAGLVCPLASATVTWGDGTPPSAGTDDGNAGIPGTHTYTEEGTYTGSVSYTYMSTVRACPPGTQTASFSANVQDAALTATGADVSGTAGRPAGGVVAHFSDANPGAAAGDFTARIDWGDGTSAAGTVGGAATGGFDVTGSHTYATSGTFTVTTSINDVGGSTAQATSSARISPAPPGPPPPPPPPTPFGPQVTAIKPLGRPTAGNQIVLTAALNTKAKAIRWDLTGDGRSDLTCSGAQTAVTFRAPSGTRRVTASAVGAAGSGSPLTTSLTVARAAPLQGAARLIGQRVTSALAKKAPVYGCAAPQDFAGGTGKTTVDRIRTRTCLVTRTVIAGGLQFEGCLRHVTSPTQVPAAESGIVFRLSLALGSGGGSGVSRLAAVRLSDLYFSDGPVSVNGVTLTPSARASIVIAPQVNAVVSSDARMSVGDLKLRNDPSFLMDLTPSGGRIPLGSFARAASPLGAIGGFALGGDVSVSLDYSDHRFGATIAAHLMLPSFLRVGGVSAQGDVKLRANNDDGLILDNLRIGPINAQLAGLGIDRLQLDYTRATREWRGQGRACLPNGACLDMIPPNGSVVIRRETLVRAGASLIFPDPGIELYPGVALNRVGFGIGLDPTRILGNAKITAVGIVGIDGRLVLAFPSVEAPFVLARDEVGNGFPDSFYGRAYTRPTFAIAADASIKLPLVGRTPLQSAYLLYEYPGYVGLGGEINQSFVGVITTTGRVGGEVNAANGRFNFSGDTNICVIDVVCRGGVVRISSHGAGGCVTIKTLLGSIGVGGGLVYSPFEIFPWPFDGCKWSTFEEPNVFSAGVRAVGLGGATGPLTVNIRRGEPSRAIRLDGVGGAPRVRVRTPDGTTLDSSSGPGLQLSRKIRIMRSERIKTTVVGLVDPRPGRYTLEPLPGSPTWGKMTEAHDQPNARVRASVQGRGTRRTLAYDVLRRPGQRVTFLERSRGASRTIGTVKGGGRGHIAFSPAPGLDRRTVVAQFELAGLPAERRVVARFSPVSPRLARVTRLRVLRRRGGLRLTWARVPGATRYEVVVTLQGGRQRVLRARRTSLTVRGVKRTDAGRVSVRAAALLRSGKPSAKRFRAQARAHTRLGPLPRATRRR